MEAEIIIEANKIPADLLEYFEPVKIDKGAVWDITTHGYKEAHFATFPEALPERIIKAGCPPGGICLDPFMGSGTTGVVAKKLGRNWLGIELSETYCAMARKRIDNTIYQPELLCIK